MTIFVQVVWNFGMNAFAMNCLCTMYNLLLASASMEDIMTFPEVHLGHREGPVHPEIYTPKIPAKDIQYTAKDAPPKCKLKVTSFEKLIGRGAVIAGIFFILGAITQMSGDKKESAIYTIEKVMNPDNKTYDLKIKCKTSHFPETMYDPHDEEIVWVSCVN
jgi:hypothetical protein